MTRFIIFRQFVLREGSLRLLYPQLSDSGVYECIASNPSGNASSSTDLSVMKKPRILSTTSTFEDFTSNTVEATVGSDIRAKLGARVIIRCPAEGKRKPNMFSCGKMTSYYFILCFIMFLWVFMLLPSYVNI